MHKSGSFGASTVDEKPDKGLLKMTRKSKYQRDLLRVRYNQTQEHWSAACTASAFQGDKTKATCHLLHNTVYLKACTLEYMHLHVMPQQ